MGAGPTYPGPVHASNPRVESSDRSTVTNRPTEVQDLPPAGGGPVSLPPAPALPPKVCGPSGPWLAGPPRNRTTPHSLHLLDHTPGTTAPAGTGPAGSGTPYPTTTALDHRSDRRRNHSMAEPVSTLRSICSDCGVSFERETSGAKCPECKPTRERTAKRIISESRRGTAKSRGYDAAWTRLSRRARRLQPFCTDCGRQDDLTTDHSPRAWARREAGLPVRLEDVDVVCRACNGDRGPARGPDAVERPTIADHRRDLSELEAGLPDDLDQRVARGEL